MKTSYPLGFLSGDLVYHQYGEKDSERDKCVVAKWPYGYKLPPGNVPVTMGCSSPIAVPVENLSYRSMWIRTDAAYTWVMITTFMLFASNALISMLWLWGCTVNIDTLMLINFMSVAVIAGTVVCLRVLHSRKSRLCRREISDACFYRRVRIMLSKKAPHS